MLPGRQHVFLVLPRSFHRGSKLYAELHLALQPLLILDMDVWMNVWGIKCFCDSNSFRASKTLLVLGAWAYFLLAARSDWPDWHKASCWRCLRSLSLVAGPSYRFDDYHLIRR